jgi:hypothetical protein
MTTVYTYVCTGCCAGWTIRSDVLRSKQRCRRCGKVSKVELRGRYEILDLHPNAKDAP